MLDAAEESNVTLSPKDEKILNIFEAAMKTIRKNDTKIKNSRKED